MDLIPIKLQIEGNDAFFLKEIYQQKAERRAIEINGTTGVIPSLKALSIALDEYYLINKLRCYCITLSYNRRIHPGKWQFTKTEFAMIDAILLMVEDGNFQYPGIGLFNDLRKLYETPLDIDTFQEKVQAIFQQIKQHSTTIYPDEQVEILSHLTNLCTPFINQEATNLPKLHFQLSNEIINLWFSQKPKFVMPHIYFRNLILIALKKGKNNWIQQLTTFGLTPNNPEIGFQTMEEWLHQFIAVYGKKLDKSHQHYQTYFAALLAYHHQDYSKATTLLKKLNRVRGTIIKLDTKKLLLMLLYDREESATYIKRKDNLEIDKILESFRGILRDEKDRKKHFADNLKTYRLFFDLFKRLYRFTTKYRGQWSNRTNLDFVKEQAAFQADLEATNSAQKEWFLERLQFIK